MTDEQFETLLDAVMNLTVHGTAAVVDALATHAGAVAAAADQSAERDAWAYAARKLEEAREAVAAAEGTP